MFRRLSLLLLLPLLSGVVYEQNLAGGPPGRTLLYDEDFEGTGLPVGWTVLEGTPDWDFAEDSQLSARFIAPSTVEDRAECDNCWANIDSIKCYEITFKLLDTTSADIWFFLTGDGIQDSHWRLQMSGTTGNISGRCANTTFSTLTGAENVVQVIEFEADAETGDCRVSLDDSAPSTVDGTAEAPADEFRGLRVEVGGPSVTTDVRIQQVEVYDGTCDI